jgi:hypothetical protein
MSRASLDVFFALMIDSAFELSRNGRHYSDEWKEIVPNIADLAMDIVRNHNQPDLVRTGGFKNDLRLSSGSLSARKVLSSLWETDSSRIGAIGY